MAAFVTGFERPTEPERDEYRRHSTLCECFSPRGIVIFNERHLRRVLSSYANTTTEAAPISHSTRIAQIRARSRHPGIGRVVAIPQVNGLHHRYERLAA